MLVDGKEDSMEKRVRVNFTLQEKLVTLARKYAAESNMSLSRYIENMLSWQLTRKGPKK